MRVRVRLYASLGRYLEGVRPGTPYEVEVPEGATVQALLEQLGAPSEETKVVFVNGRVCPTEWALKPGDEVGAFPPIGGG